jgi:hypothetical protein
MRVGASFLASMLALGPACYAGVQSYGSGGDEEGSGSAGTSGGSEDGDGEPNPSACEPAAQRVTLLSNLRYGNAVRDLLGLSQSPLVSNGGGTQDAFLPVGVSQVDPMLVFEYHGIAQTAAEEAITGGLLPACDADELACAEAFIDDFGTRAFRRPLTDDERAGLLGVYEVGREQDGDHEGGLRLVIVAALQAPSFLYVTEIGEPEDDGTLALTPWEVASQLSFFLLDTLPDEQLRADAAEGRLATQEGIEAAVDRILQSPEGRASVSRMVVRWLGSDRIMRAEKEAPEFTESLRESMRQETALLVDHVLWSGSGTLRELFTTSETFVNAELAAHYGLPTPADEGFSRVQLPPDQRMGVLTHASLLASLAGVHETSIVYRGLFVARDLLCMKFPPPPDGALDMGLDESVGERARSEHRMATVPCSGCHGSFDPFGILFEGYDALGRHRTTIGDEPVDASFDIPYPQTLAGPTTDVLELAARLGEADEVTQCATQRAATYAAWRSIDSDLSCQVDELSEAILATDGEVSEIVRQIATSPLMRWRRVEEGQ